MARSNLNSYNPYRQQMTTGIPYQSVYDPANDQRTAQLMMGENQKAMQALAGVQAQQAATGDIFSYDEAGKKERIDEFKGRTSQIKDKFNNDLALAAPALAQTIADERTNPWYQKNAAYTEQYQRRQKLVDQFGPNLMMFKDLPTGNLKDVNMEDINFEYLNRQHLYDIYKQNMGHLANKLTPIGLHKDPNNAGMLRSGQRKGLTENEALEAAKEHSAVIDQIIQERGLTDTPEVRNTLRAEQDLWAQNNLVGGTAYQYRQDPTFDTSGGGNVFPGVIPTKDIRVSGTNVETNNMNPEEMQALKQSRGWKTGEPLNTSDENLPKEISKAIKNDKEYQQILEAEPLFAGDHEFIQNELVGFGTLSSTEQGDVIDFLNTTIRGDFKPVSRFMNAIGATGTKERIDVLQEMIQDRFGIGFTDFGVKNLVRKFDAHNNWLTTSYIPKEKELLSKGPEVTSQTSVFIPDAQASAAISKTMDTFINSGISKEFTYFDENLSTIDNKRKGFKSLDSLLGQGYDVTNVAIVKGTHTSPNIFQLTLSKGDEKSEVIRFSPNSANRMEVIEELSTITQNPTYLYAERSRELWNFATAAGREESKKGKIFMEDILNENFQSDHHVAKVKRNGQEQFALVNTETNDIVETSYSNDLAELVDSWILSTEDDQLKAAYLPQTTVYNFYNRIYGENMSKDDIKEASLGYIMQTLR